MENGQYAQRREFSFIFFGTVGQVEKNSPSNNLFKNKMLFLLFVVDKWDAILSTGFQQIYSHFHGMGKKTVK